MPATMHIVTIKDTGHIVAAVSQVTTAGDPDLTALVGNDLPLWQPRKSGDAHSATQSLLPAEILEVKTVPLDAAVIAAPLWHVVDGGRVVALPEVAANEIGISLSATEVTLEKGTAGTIGLCVVAADSGPTDERRVQAGKIPANVPPGGDTELILPLSILPDDTAAAIPSGADYNVMVAFAGKRLTWLSFGI